MDVTLSGIRLLDCSRGASRSRSVILLAKIDFLCWQFIVDVA